MKALMIVMVVFSVGTASAALPPQAQQNRDLEVMQQFVQAHSYVQQTLRFIDSTNFIVHYAEDCEARFSRKRRFVLPGWVGPEAPLVFQHSNCRIE